MRLAIEDAMPLLDHGEADRLGQAALGRAGRADEQGIGVLGDSAGGGELKHKGAVHRLVEVEGMSGCSAPGGERHRLEGDD